ncbi:MAG: VWA domain-containing protein [Saprospiraceae bacterium]|nr:VWA domain-containing protein [Saprospiraceae bacterium]MBP7699638.1 VWA domain-containing protein [Saprospiraceae bacterium]
MRGWSFSKWTGNPQGSVFDKLFDIFKELLVYTNGNVDEAISWLTELDKEYNLTSPDYGISDFIEELKVRGYLQQHKQQRGLGLSPSSKMDLAIRRKALDDLFGQIKKAKSGNHNTLNTGNGDEFTSDVKPFEYGDKLEHIAITNTIRNAQINHGIDDFQLTNNDVELYETFFQSQMSTVLMIDISHSMILYGEDRITPAKKVAMALSELIMTRYPKDTLDIIVFGNDAWQIEVKDLPYLQVGPYHTNTVAGLELAMNLLRKRKNPNKQIFMVTDGKPTCIKRGKEYYKNSWGLDKLIIRRTLNLAQQCRKLHIPITTFMIADDPYLIEFINQFTAANNGKAFYSSLQGLGEFIFQDYKANKLKKR